MWLPLLLPPGAQRLLVKVTAAHISHENKTYRATRRANRACYSEPAR